MSRRETSEEIDVAAARWAARLNRAALGQSDRADLNAWLAGDPRRLGALTRAEAVLVHFDRVQALGPRGLDRMPDGASSSPFWHRRSTRIAMTTLAASLVGIVSFALLRTSDNVYATHQGEIRSVALADGSTIILDTASEASVVLGPDRRQVRLIAGRALFDVAKDRRKPFVVRTGDVTVTAVGTSFSVDHQLKNKILVVMREGVVDVTRGSDGRFRRRLHAQEILALAPGGAVVETRRDAQAVGRQLSWREGMLDFENETLSAAAAQFNRYSEYHIVPAADVTQMRITGRFSSSNPRGFAEAVGTSLRLRVAASPTEVRIER